MMKLLLSVDGMTCSSCVSTVTVALQSLNGVSEVIVSLSTNTATLRFDPLVINSTDISRELEDVGFDAKVLSEESVPIKLSLTSFNKLVLSIEGMTCSSCSSTVETALLGIPSIRNVTVSLTTNSATLEYDPLITSSTIIIEEIESVGFDARSMSDSQLSATSVSENTSDLSIDKYYSQSKSLVLTFDTKILMNNNELEEIASMLRSEEGIESIQVNNGDNQLLITFYEFLIGPRGFLSTIQHYYQEKEDSRNNSNNSDASSSSFPSHGFDIRKDIIVSSVGGFMMANRLIKQQLHEKNELGKLLFFSLLLTIPVFLIGMVFPLEGKNASTHFLYSEIPGIHGLTISSLIQFLLTTPIQFIIGYRFHKKAYYSLVKTWSFGMDFMISTGTFAAYLYSLITICHGMLSSSPSSTTPMKSGSMNEETYFDTSAVLITAILLGKYFEIYAKSQTTNAIQKLSSLKANNARLVGTATPVSRKEKNSPVSSSYSPFSEEERRFLRSSSSSAVSSSAPTVTSVIHDIEEGRRTGISSPVSSVTTEDIIIDSSWLHKYDIVRLVVGETIPADGILFGEGSSVSVDESLLTGESRMINKKENDNLHGGAIIVEGSALMKVIGIGDDSTLGKIIQTVQEAQISKPEIQELADKFAKLFVPIVMGISLITFLVWIVVAEMKIVDDVSLKGGPFLFAFSFSLAVWVSACPCAFGLATPTAILVATGMAARNGILVRKGAALQTASEVCSSFFGVNSCVFIFLCCCLD
jgi:Cu+-exporting ATPase